jgi:hypothetical protein
MLLGFKTLHLREKHLLIYSRLSSHCFKAQYGLLPSKVGVIGIEAQSSLADLLGHEFDAGGGGLTTGRWTGVCRQL